MISLCHGAKASGPENSCPRLHTAVNASPSLRFASSTLLRSCRVSPEGVSSDLHVFNTLPKHFPVSSNRQKGEYILDVSSRCVAKESSTENEASNSSRDTQCQVESMSELSACAVKLGLTQRPDPLTLDYHFQKDFPGDLIAWSLLCNRKRGDPGMQNDDKVGPT